MPIRFRCGYCDKLLGIARRKAGAETTCPHCGATITVPTPDEVVLEEIDALLQDDNPHPIEHPPAPAAAPVVVGSQKATAVVIAVVVLLATAFAAGFLIALR